MSKLAELRARANNTKEVQAQRAARIAEAVKDVVRETDRDAQHGESIKLSDEKMVNKFAERVATRVSEVVSDPINSFIDTLRARGMNQNSINKTVEKVNSVFLLTESEDPMVQLRVVATYIENNPHLYDEIGALWTKR